MKIGIITQARMTSTRLPGKVLKKIAGRPMLEYHLVRLLDASYPVIVATTNNSQDDEVAKFCSGMNIPIYRGNENDVLSRYYECALQNSLDAVVRVTSDCPLIDGNLINEAIQEYKNHFSKNLYLSNCMDRTYPRGMDFEIFSFKLLEEAFRNANLQIQREHVTPYINRNVSGKVLFRSIRRIKDGSKYRLTVDTQEDFDLVKILIEEYDCDKKNIDGIIEVLDKHPELVLINAHIEQKKS